MADKLKSRRWKLALTLITLIALLGMAYAVRAQLLQTIRNIPNVNIVFVLLLIPLQILSYHAQTKLYQGIFKILGNKIRYRFMYRVALELNLVNNIFPSAGVSGFSYLSVRMRAYGVSAARATIAQMMRFILLFVAFQVYLFVGLLALAIEGEVSSVLILVAGSLGTLLTVATFGIGFVIGSKQRISSFFTFLTRLLNRIIHIFRKKHPETINVSRAREAFTELHENYMHVRRNLLRLRRPLLYGLLANFAEVACIYAIYAAFGQWINPGVVIIAYAVANFAGLISVLPGGVGIYEALMTAILAAGGVSPAVSIPVTVMYRVLNMVIQLPPGYFFYQRALREVSGETTVSNE